MIGDQLQNDSETFLLKLLRTFRPREDKLAVGHSYWRICLGVLKLEGKRFSLDNLEKIVHKDSTFGKEQTSKKEISTVLEQLKRNGFLDSDANGFKPVSPEAAEALNEFFAFEQKPRTGKMGFAKYLTKTQKRLMMWYCLHEPHVLSAEKAANFTVCLSKQKCEEFLERFSSPRTKWLSKVSLQTYCLKDRESLFTKLLEEYNAYCFSVPSMRDYIIIILSHYKKVSGKMIREDLEEEGIKCDPKTVYNHMKNLENEGILNETGDSRKVRGAHEEFWAVNLGRYEESSKDLIASIEKRMKRSSLSVSDEFYKYANEQRPTELTNFAQTLRWGLVLRSPDQNSTLPLWLKLFEELYPKVFSPMLSGISNVPPENPDEKLEAISNNYKMSPLITSILYYSLCKSPKKDTDKRKNQQ